MQLSETFPPLTTPFTSLHPVLPDQKTCSSRSSASFPSRHSPTPPQLEVVPAPSPGHRGHPSHPLHSCRSSLGSESASRHLYISLGSSIVPGLGSQVSQWLVFLRHGKTASRGHGMRASRSRGVTPLLITSRTPRVSEKEAPIHVASRLAVPPVLGSSRLLLPQPPWSSQLCKDACTLEPFTHSFFS